MNLIINPLLKPDISREIPNKNFILKYSFLIFSSLKLVIKLRINNNNIN